MTFMPSYFRNWFGGGSNSSASASASNAKSHSRSQSSTMPNIYAPPTTATTTANVSRSHSYSATRATNPSPLRYATGADTRTTYGYGKAARSAAAPYPAERPTERRAYVPKAAYGAREPANYAMHAPSATYITPPSSRSNSSTSLFNGSVPVSSSSDAGHYGRRSTDSRPPLRQNQTWQPGSSVGSTSSYGGSVRGHSSAHSAHSHSSPYARPRTPALYMHPLLAYTRLHHAPLTYDVAFTPSARTVLDRATHSAIPPHTLSQPATEPPMPSGSKLVLRSHKFPWPVIVTAPSACTASPGPRFAVGAPKHSRSASGGTITNLDVLYAVHTTLMTQVTPEEWEALGQGSRAQQKVTRAYERRCTRMGGGWEHGVRRVDWLGEKTRLVGVEVDKSAGGGTGKLVFAKE